MGILDVPSVARSKVESIARTASLRPVVQEHPIAIPPVPTISASSGVTNPYVIPAVTSFVVDQTNFHYFGMNPKVAGAQSPNAGGVIGDNLSCFQGSAGVGVAFRTDSRLVEFPIRGYGQTIEITMKADDGFAELLYATVDRASGTARSGGTNTIQLASGDTAIEGAYNTAWIFITGGTGSGQSRQITAFNATTKTVTVGADWSVQPDATSAYRVNQLPAPFSIPNDGGSTIRYILIDTGSRASRVFTYRSTAYFLGVRIDSSGSVTKHKPRFNLRNFNVRDSFGGGTAGGVSGFTGAGAFLAKRYGWEQFFCDVGGTGLLAISGGTQLNYRCRIVPPRNSWIIDRWGVTAGGTFTITQGNVTTASLAWNTPYTTMQTTLDAAFGANVWKAVSHPYYGYVIVRLDSDKDAETALTVTPSGLTGTLQTTRYLGDIEPFVPRDAFGNSLPFVITLAGSLNDDGQTYPTLPTRYPIGGPSSGSTVTDIQTEGEYLIAECKRRFPTCLILMIGRNMNRGPGNLQTQKDNNAGLEAAALSLPLINGRLPFVKTMDSVTGAGYIRGTTNITNGAGVAGVNSDRYIAWDQTHYMLPGYVWIDEYSQSYLDPIFIGD